MANRRQVELIAHCRETLNNRNDLTPLIKSEIGYAIAHYERKRFWFNETIFDAELTPASNGEFPVPSDLMHFDKLTIDSRDGRKLDSKNYNLLSNDNSTGDPKRFYRYRQSFFIRPITNRNRQIYCHYIRSLPDLVDDLDDNAWTDEAEELIHARVVSRIMNDRLKEYDQSDRYERKEIKAFNDLTNYTVQRNATGKVTKYRI